MPNTKTIKLTGSETEVRFDANYPYFWVKNLGGGDVYMSASPNIVPDADGVTLVPAGEGRSTGDVGQANALYFLGSGKVEISPQHNAVCPFFKHGAEGGDVKNSLLPHSDGLTYFFDYQKGVASTGWTDLESGYVIGKEMTYNDEYAGFEDGFDTDWNVRKSFTVYVVLKEIKTIDDARFYVGLKAADDSRWLGIASDKNRNIELLVPKSSYAAPVTNTNYNIAAFTVFDDTVRFYVNNTKYWTYNISNWQTYVDFWTIYGGKENDNERFYKSIAIFENVAQNDDDISANTQYLAEKYGIEI